MSTPIARGEFLQCLQRCMPKTGWPASIAVANSAGPDSVCLLFLLADLIHATHRTHGLPTRVYSIHVNHNLQPLNTQMALRAEAIARRVGATPLTTSIPWGSPPFPARPANGEPIEELARAARQNRLLHAMVSENIDCIAFGHHADDQVETAVMRVMKGTGELGAAGMRSLRRWGMGNAGLDYAGAQGMRRWVVRPLLEIPKSRIYATCEAHRLDYVTDTTNFQPAITLRNHVRQYLSRREQASPIDEEERDIERAVQTLLASTPGRGDIPHLREAVRHKGYRLDVVESRATAALKHALLPSPPSTLLLSVPLLTHHYTRDPAVRTALVRRVLRYVSPRPWGAPSAVAGGSSPRLAKIVAALWPSPSTVENEGGDGMGPAAFSPASRTRFARMLVRPDGAVRAYRPGAAGTGSGTVAWCVSRDAFWSLPRPGREGEAAALRRGRVDNEPLGGIMDITHTLLDAYQRGEESVEVLYDGRFAVRVQVGRVWEQGGRVVIQPDSRFFLPTVVWRTHAASSDGTSKAAAEEEEGHVLAAYQHKTWCWTAHPDAKEMELKTVPWISISFIRTIDAV